jgi:hypothetical protein
MIAISPEELIESTPVPNVVASRQEHTSPPEHNPQPPSNDSTEELKNNLLIQKSLVDNLSQRLQHHEHQQGLMEDLREQVKCLENESMLLLKTVPEVQQIVLNTNHKMKLLKDERNLLQEDANKISSKSYYCPYVSIWKPYINPYISLNSLVVGAGGLVAGYFWLRNR